MNKKAWIAMSGGVDSAAAALLMREQGYDCAGVTLLLCENDNGSGAAEAAKVCEKLGISHETLDLRETFRRTVMEPFLQGYEEGQTPNPCIFCNRYLKFGYLLAEAEARGYDQLSTGHYARITRDEAGGLHLRKGKDAAKDQSYVLYMLGQKELTRVCFPLGDYTKAEVRALAAQAGFSNASRSDSQDICFVPDGDYAAFLRRFGGKSYPAGDFVTIDGKTVGRHHGIVDYTVGQRRGLGLSLPAPLYVVEKDVPSNRVILGRDAALYRRTVEAEEAFFVREMPKRFPCTAKLRYHQKDAPAQVELTEKGFRLFFAEPQRAPAAGQAAVLYDGDELLGGGRITGAE